MTAPTPQDPKLMEKAREILGGICIDDQYTKDDIEDLCSDIALALQQHGDEKLEYKLKTLYEPVWLDGAKCEKCEQGLCYCPERQIVKDEWHENILTKAIRLLKRTV